MLARTARRLPGFRFETRTPELRDTLPRMDVAAFVGFAASGPLQLPVAVEDVAQFSAIYGEDVPLGWDKENGEQVYAYLAPAVRSFFRNGGRRCWIIRVAGKGAKANYFPIPGLARAAYDSKKKVKITPAFARARSEGSWSDSLKVGASLAARPIEVIRLSYQGLVADLALRSVEKVTKGDLLRVTFRKEDGNEGYSLLTVAKSVKPIRNGSPPEGRLVRVAASHALWFTTRLPGDSFAPAQATLFTREPQPAESSSEEEQIDFAGNPVEVLSPPDWSKLDTDKPFKLELNVSLSDAPLPGSLARINVQNQELWLRIQDLGIGEETGSPPGQSVVLTAQGFWLLKKPPQPLPQSIQASEILTFELWIRQNHVDGVTLGDLGFEADHARYWARLPTDFELYEEMEKARSEGRAELAFEKERVELWRPTAEKRFPLAGYRREGFYFPFMMPIIPDHYLGPIKRSASQLERDGLSTFDSSLFLDRDMTEIRMTALMGQADFLRYLSPSPRRLNGIHAALAVEEATIIAVPDVVHRSWIRSSERIPRPELPSSPPERPEWWHFLDCDPPPKIPRTSEPQRGHFLDCNIVVVPAPILQRESEPDLAGSFTLTWSSDSTGAKFVLEESLRSDFSDAVTIYQGPKNRLAIYGRSPGDYYYRVRAEVEGCVSDWSKGVFVRVREVNGWQLQKTDDYSPETLLAVDRALLRMCAARADLFAVLALPEHYRGDEAAEHIRSLKLTPDQVGNSKPSADPDSVEPLGYNEASAFSYGAVYHPWVIGRQEDKPDRFRRLPPEGAACGILARRSLDRGAWIAPANEMLRGVVALTPKISRDDFSILQEAQANIIRQEPRGFLTLSADTLSDDADLRPINVRRLLTLLRRLAMRLGPRYVFEPNDDSFRRLVQRGFETMLTEMFLRGAFAGATAARSFQVVVDSSVNPAHSIEQGRFIVEIRVAPSLPMTFLTIRLVQSGERTFITEGR